MENAAQVPDAQNVLVPQNLSTQQIERLGELLVQYGLLRRGIDSSPMTVDAGIDLVAYSGTTKRAITIRVKTNLAPKPGGGGRIPMAGLDIHLQR